MLPMDSNVAELLSSQLSCWEICWSMFNIDECQMVQSLKQNGKCAAQTIWWYCKTRLAADMHHLIFLQHPQYLCLCTGGLSIQMLGSLPCVNPLTTNILKWSRAVYTASRCPMRLRTSSQCSKCVNKNFTSRAKRSLSFSVLQRCVAQCKDAYWSSDEIQPIIRYCIISLSKWILNCRYLHVVVHPLLESSSVRYNHVVAQPGHRSDRHLNSIVHLLWNLRMIYGKSKGCFQAHWAR